MIKNAFKLISYVLFPKRCQLCGEVIDICEKLCIDCKSNKRIDGEICNKCGFSKEDCLCKDNTPKSSYKCVVAPFYYSDGIVKSVHRLKFYGFKELSLEMAKQMTVVIKKEYGDVDFDVLTFVPATKLKVWKRGYNQAELIANELSKQLNIPCEKVLVKIRETDTQRSLTANERRMNLYGAYDLRNGYDVTSKTILLVDDVKTTGSTLNECSQVLKGYGAKCVYTSTFAITKLNKR